MNKQLTMMDNRDDSNPVASTPERMIKRAMKEIKEAAVPGVVSIGTLGVGYVLLFGHTIYNTLAMMLGLGLGSRQLDPSTVLECWEEENKKHALTDDREKKVAGLFG